MGFLQEKNSSIVLSKMMSNDLKSNIFAYWAVLLPEAPRKIFANIISSKPAVGWFSLRQWRHKISDFWQNCENFCTVGKQPPELTMMFVLTMNFRESRQSLEGEQEMLESLEASLS